MDARTPLKNTIYVLYRSLLPPKAASGTIDGQAGLGDIYPGIGNIRSGNCPDAASELFLPAVLPLAAPFILFRLKRRGFSESRVTARPGGLLVTAFR